MVKDRNPDLNDSWYTVCSDDEINFIHQKNSQIYQLANFTIPTVTLVLSAVGLVVNTVFVYLVIKGLREKLLPFKGYSLLLNRSITDLLIGLLTLIFVSLHKFDQINVSTPDPFSPNNFTDLVVNQVEYLIPHGRTVFTLLLTVNFWAVALAYATLALFTYIAVKYPMYYKVKMTNRRTVIVMIFVWILGAVYSAIVVALSSNNAFNVFNSASDVIQWSVSSVDYALSISNLVIVLIALVLVLGSYAFIIWYLWKKSAISGNASLHLGSIGRLALNILAFVATCVVMALFVSLPLFLKNHIDGLLTLQQMTFGFIQGTNICSTVVATYRLGGQMAVWTTLAMTGWMLRIILDPIANLLIDSRFKLVLTKVFEVARRRGFYRPTKMVIAPVRPPVVLPTTTMDFLRKCAQMNVMPISMVSTESSRYFRFTDSESPSVTPKESKPLPKKSIRNPFGMDFDSRVL